MLEALRDCPLYLWIIAGLILVIRVLLIIVEIMLWKIWLEQIKDE